MDQNAIPPKPNTLNINSENAAHSVLSFIGLSYLELAANTDLLIPLQGLAQSAGYQEYWSDGTAVKVNQCSNSSTLKAVNSEHHLVLSFQYNDEPLHQMVCDVYQQAYELSGQMGFDYLIRTWNYLDGINTIENNTERYQTFCVARHQALEQISKLNKPNPAATAIGGHMGKNAFIFLFSKTPGQVVENKRQISAWQYPQQYAPKQPRFSRAMQCGDLLMCSGTASVVGHETIHLNDLTAQFNECLINVQALLDESSLSVALELGLYRFYLRDKMLVNQVIRLIESRKIQSYIILEGDICRENLLIECEAVFQ